MLELISKNQWLQEKLQQAEKERVRWQGKFKKDERRRLFAEDQLSQSRHQNILLRHQNELLAQQVEQTIRVAKSIG